MIMPENLLSQIAQIMDLSQDEVVNHSRFLINVFDRDHRVLFWNKKCERYFGITEEEALGEILEDLIPTTRDHPKMKLLSAALSGKTVFVAEEKYDRKNAHYTQIVIPLTNGEGEIVAAVNIVSDIPQPVGKVGIYGTLVKM